MPYQIIVTENGHTEIVPTGPVGPSGPRGPQGIQGPTGPSGQDAYPSGMVVVDAGDNLDIARPDAFVVYFKFNDPTVVAGGSGENITNAMPGDMWFVPDA